MQNLPDVTEGKLCKSGVNISFNYYAKVHLFSHKKCIFSLNIPQESKSMRDLTS